MKDITKNEMRILLRLFKDIDIDYNANSLGKAIGLTSMGSLKILKNLETQGILNSKPVGKAIIYKINFDSYTKDYLKLLLQKEAEEALPRIKRWVKELRKFKDYSESGILFGSCIKKDNFDDIDLLLISKQNQNLKINKIAEEITKLNSKKIHIVKQSSEDIISNLKKNNNILLDILSTGIVISGYDKMIEVVKVASQR
jgi:predicted nucleotidyltransferase